MSSARSLTLLAGAAVVGLWGCGGALQPGSPMDEPGGTSGAAGGAGTGVRGVTDGGAAGAAGSPAPHVPGPCIEPAADASLARFQTGVVGSWLGTATTPSGWVWSRATVEFTFFCDGHYHARCLGAEGGFDPEYCVALYYGTDDDNPQKTYEIHGAIFDGKATATIVVFFSTGNTTTHDQLDAIDLAAAGDQLTFDFIHLGQYGPIHYDLQRVP